MDSSEPPLSFYAQSISESLLNILQRSSNDSQRQELLYSAGVNDTNELSAMLERKLNIVFGGEKVDRNRSSSQWGQGNREHMDSDIFSDDPQFSDDYEPTDSSDVYSSQSAMSFSCVPSLSDRHSDFSFGEEPQSDECFSQGSDHKEKLDGNNTVDCFSQESDDSEKIVCTKGMEYFSQDSDDSGEESNFDHSINFSQEIDHNNKIVSSMNKDCFSQESDYSGEERTEKQTCHFSQENANSSVPVNPPKINQSCFSQESRTSSHQSEISRLGSEEFSQDEC